MLPTPILPPVNFRSFRKKLSLYRKTFRSYINRAEKNPKGIDKITPVLEAEVWNEVDCLSCANCCKKMTPTFTETDLKRIAPHFQMTIDEFKKKWLKKQRNGDWVNVLQPCQFLDLNTNMCGIYSIRPADCAGFPHLSKRKWDDYAHVHKQNIDYCPATFKMIEKMIGRIAK